jgi:hypothetical protein
MGLTVKQVLRLKQRGKYADRDGLYLQVLYLQVMSETNRSWLYRYARKGKAHWLGLGSEKDVTLYSARAKAFKAREQLRAGIDPILAKKQARQSRLLAEMQIQTFEDCAAGFFMRIRLAGRQTHARTGGSGWGPMCTQRLAS